MAEPDVRFVVHGVEQLEGAFDAMIADLTDELRDGFVPEARYRGQGGVPYTAERIELVGRRNLLDTD